MNRIASITTAALAATASGQIIGVVRTDGSTFSGGPGPLTLSLSIVVVDDGGFDIEGFDLAVTATSTLGPVTLSNPVVLQEGFFSTAQIDDGRVEVAAGDSFSGELDDYQTGFTLAVFDLIVPEIRKGTVTLTLTAGDNSVLGNQGFPLAVNTGGFPPVPEGLNATLESYIFIVPSPAAAFPVGFAGLIAARRRRG